VIKDTVKLTLAIFMIVSLSSCASILTGTNQDITVATPDCANAQCTLSNDEGRWQLEEVPGTVTVAKASTTLVIECGIKNSDAETSISTVKSGYEGLVWGNILVGGLIGLFVDMGTGAINKYDEDHVDVDLVCNKG